MLQLILTMTTAQVFETSVVYVAGVERGRGNFFCAHEGESSPFSLLPPPSSLLPSPSRVVSRPNSLPLPFRAPATQAKTSVTVNSSPIQDYDHPDDHVQPTYEMAPGFKPFTIKIFVCLCLFRSSRR